MTTLRMIPGITYTRKNLEALTGMPDRANRHMIRAQRRQGVPIVALPDGGYKLAETDEEKKMLLAMLPVIEQATQYLREAGIPTWRHWCYVLVQDVDDANSRVEHLREMGITPFAQPYRDYDGGDPTAEQKRFARWCNDKAVFASCKFDDYGRARGV